MLCSPSDWIRGIWWCVNSSRFIAGVNLFSSTGWYKFYIWSWVGILNKLRDRRTRNLGSIPAIARDFSILDEVIGIFNWPNPSSRTVAVRSTQPLIRNEYQQSSCGRDWGNPHRHLRLDSWCIGRESIRVHPEQKCYSMRERAAR
jgi:hypothetical protein